MRVRESRRPKDDSVSSAEATSRKIGAEFREAKRGSAEQGSDSKRPVEGGTMEGYSKVVAGEYRRRKRQVGGEETGRTKNPDGAHTEYRSQPQGPWPKTEDHDKIRKLYFQEGLSLDDVAKEVGVSRRQIQRAFEAEGFTPRPRGGQPVLESEAHQEIRKLYFDEGLSLSQVARRLGCSATTVGEVLRNEGWPARPQRGRTKWDDETIRKRYFDESAVRKDDAARHSQVQPQGKKVDRDEVYRLHFEEGLPHQAIAERLSASVKTIGRIFREEGWVPRGLQKTSERDERSRKRNDYQVTRRQEIASIRESVFGSNCRLCGETSDRFSIHRKDGEKHVSSLFQSPARLRALNPEEWAYLDYDCHFAVHLMMNNFGYDWLGIEKLAKNLREQAAQPPEIRSGTSQNDRRSEERVRPADTSVQNADDLRRTMFGSSCVMCGKDENEVHLVIHKMDGEAHDPQMLHSRKYLLTCDPAEWVALCIPCHYVTHWAMRRFHANWEQIRGAFLTDN